MFPSKVDIWKTTRNQTWDIIHTALSKNIPAEEGMLGVLGGWLVGQAMGLASRRINTAFLVLLILVNLAHIAEEPNRIYKCILPRKLIFKKKCCKHMHNEKCFFQAKMNIHICMFISLKRPFFQNNMIYL